jgi:hypothetical protein
MRLFTCRCFTVVLAAFALFVGPSATPASAQSQMSFSFFTGYAISGAAGEWLDIVVDGEDDSTGCMHTDYSTWGRLYAPSGVYDNYGGLSVGFWTAADDGDYGVSSSLTVTCSCISGSFPAGGVTESANVTKFRAVFDYRNPNGNKYEYGAFCTHSCQPSRVCTPQQAAFAFFEGRKLVTPAASRCDITTPVLHSAGYATNPCLGTGYGLLTTFDPQCPF